MRENFVHAVGYLERSRPDAHSFGSSRFAEDRAALIRIDWAARSYQLIGLILAALAAKFPALVGFKTFEHGTLPLSISDKLHPPTAPEKLIYYRPTWAPKQLRRRAHP
jgi:hypothetical protein